MIASHKANSPLAGGLLAENNTGSASIHHAEKAGKPNRFDAAEFRDLRGRFAARGYCLQKVCRAEDGRLTFHVMRGEATRILSHPHDLRAYLAQIEDAPWQRLHLPGLPGPIKGTDRHQLCGGGS